MIEATEVDTRDPYTIRVEEAAQARGLIVVRPAPAELFIDIDDAPSMAVFRLGFEILSGVEECDWVIRPSPSGKPERAHIVVTLDRPVRDAFERILLQLALGSDRKHELCSWIAATNDAPHPTVFFERPPACPVAESAP